MCIHSFVHTRIVVFASHTWFCDLLCSIKNCSQCFILSSEMYTKLGVIRSSDSLIICFILKTIHCNIKQLSCCLTEKNNSYADCNWLLGLNNHLGKNVLVVIEIVVKNIILRFIPQLLVLPCRARFYWQINMLFF